MDHYIIVQGTRNDQKEGLKGEDQNGRGPGITVRRTMIATAASLVAIVLICIFIKGLFSFPNFSVQKEEPSVEDSRTVLTTKRGCRRRASRVVAGRSPLGREPLLVTPA
ncbi:uncharacterized protein LOC134769939 isoform X2 [Penaeus indicus]|uniref:uncharacterized protein LOC134769939 isoform X2 n=1 Tax=Penaeus indicus TaxID=29960 RepID=UPI00300C1320